MAMTVDPSARSAQMKPWERALGSMQTLGRALMLPIAVLPAAALLLRIGQPDLANLSWMAAAGNAVFSNLPLLFAVGIAVGLAGGDGAAGLAAVVGHVVFLAVFQELIPKVGGAPDPAIQMGVLSGFIVGITTGYLFRRFHDIRLPDYLAFFGGRRFVPIVTAFVTLGLGALFGWIWPSIQDGINAFGRNIVDLGAVGTGLFGFFNRLLIPVGLHHVLNAFTWFQLGTYQPATGPVVHGDLTRYFAGDPTAGNFMAGFFPIMMFGLPAAALAMIRQARIPKVAAGILLSAALASFLTGITEPIEFAFLFVAPLLYLVHCVLTGTALALATLLHMRIGFGFSAGAIDFALNFSKSNTNNPIGLLVLGLGYGVVYYFVFSFVIKRFDLATPGRGESRTGLSADWILPESQRGPRAAAGGVAAEPGATATATMAGDRDDELAGQIVAALGGAGNIESVEGCITRLRLFLADPDRVDEPRLMELGASGVVRRGKLAQVVMGTQSDRIAARMNRQIKEGR